MAKGFREAGQTVANAFYTFADKPDNLAMDVRFNKEKSMENIKEQNQAESEKSEAERVEAEIVYSPMTAETQEYQYNVDAFEARGMDAVKQEAV